MNTLFHVFIWRKLLLSSKSELAIHFLYLLESHSLILKRADLLRFLDIDRIEHLRVHLLLSLLEILSLVVCIYLRLRLLLFKEFLNKMRYCLVFLWLSSSVLWVLRILGRLTEHNLWGCMTFNYLNWILSLILWRKSC